MADRNMAFYITTEDGKDIFWEGLTAKQAMDIERVTRLHPPKNILRFGWGRDRSRSTKGEKNDSPD
jgi:hypothetical protein